MRLKHILAAVSLLAATGAALADGLTRADVAAQVRQTRAAGLLDMTEARFPAMPEQPSTLTREQVRAAAVQARANGELDITEGDYPHIAPQPSTLTRAQVRAEVLAARASGLLDLNEVNYPREYANGLQPRVQAQPMQASLRTSSLQR